MKTLRLVVLGLTCCLILAGCLFSGGCGGDGGAGPAVQVGVDWQRVADDGGMLFSSPGESVYVTDVCAGGPGLVAVGYGVPTNLPQDGSWHYTLEIWTSPDGRAWSRLGPEAFISGASPNLRKEYTREKWSEPRIISGPAGLVVTAGLHVFRSQDGLRWNEVKDVAAFDSSTCEMNSATGRFTFTYAADHFVDVTGTASGYVASVLSDSTRPGSQGWLPGPSIWVSPDSENWSLVQLEYIDVFAMDSVNSITPGGPGLVAVGGGVASDYESMAGSAQVWTGTPDGLAWTHLPENAAVFGGPGDQMMNAAAQGGPGLVAAGSESSDVSIGKKYAGVVWTSPNGTAWSRSASGDAALADAELSAVAAGGPGPVAAGLVHVQESIPDKPLLVYTNAAAWTSPDGLAWTRVLLPRAQEASKSSESASGIASFPGGLIVVGHTEVKGEPARGVIWTSLGQ